MPQMKLAIQFSCDGSMSPRMTSWDPKKWAAPESLCPTSFASGYGRNSQCDGELFDSIGYFNSGIRDRWLVLQRQDVGADLLQRAPPLRPAGVEGLCHCVAPASNRASAGKETPRV